MQRALKDTASSVAKAARDRRNATAQEVILQQKRDAALVREVEAEDDEMLTALDALSGNDHPADHSDSSSSAQLSTSETSSACRLSAQMPFVWLIADMLKLLSSESALHAATWSDLVLSQLLQLMDWHEGPEDAEYVSVSASRPLGSHHALVGSRIMLEVLDMPGQGQDSLIDYLKGHKNALQMVLSIVSMLPNGPDRSRLADVTAPLLLDVAVSLPCQPPGMSEGLDRHNSAAQEKSMNPECRRKEACKQLAVLFGDDLGSLKEFIIANSLVSSFCRTRWKSPQLLGLKRNLEEQQAGSALKNRRSASRQQSASRSVSQSAPEAAAKPEDQPSPTGGQVQSVRPQDPRHLSLGRHLDKSSWRCPGMPRSANSVSLAHTDPDGDGLHGQQGSASQGNSSHDAEQAAEADDSHFGPKGWSMVTKGRGKKHSAAQTSTSQTAQQVAHVLLLSLRPWIDFKFYRSCSIATQCFTPCDSGRKVPVANAFCADMDIFLLDCLTSGCTYRLFVGDVALACATGLL